MLHNKEQRLTINRLSSVKYRFSGKEFKKYILLHCEMRLVGSLRITFAIEKAIIVKYNAKSN